MPSPLESSNVQIKNHSNACAVLSAEMNICNSFQMKSVFLDIRTDCRHARKATPPNLNQQQSSGDSPLTTAVYSRSPSLATRTSLSTQPRISHKNNNFE
jgi:hypothetical protein